MMYIKKSLLALLLAAAIVCGAAGCYFANDLGLINLVGSSGVSISQKEYEEYKDLKKTYGKAEVLKDRILSSYYTDVDEAKLTEGMYYGLFDALGDVYSSYISAKDYDYMMASVTGSYSGVGITMEARPDTGTIVVNALNEYGPAYSSGIHIGDIIFKVDGIEYGSSTMDVCAAKVRGKAGTKVTITVLRNNEELDFTITRAEIITRTVSSKMLTDDIGYIKLSSFDESSVADFKAALEEIESQGAKHFVFDIRNNPGGLVPECVQIADMLMNEGTVVYIEDHNGARQYLTTKNGRTDMDYVLLINEHSASSSEILSAGIQDNKEGTIVGTLSFGKGIIQAMDKIYDGSGFKLTEWQYFSPNGNAIHKKGITPDYVVELTDDCYDEEGNLINDLQLEKAIELLSK